MLAVAWSRRPRAKTQEQKEIGRELHDRVAHTMVLIHHSLQLHEVYEERGEPQKAAEKLELAKRMAAEAIDQTRDPSRALTSGNVAQGLEALLSELLSGLVPPGLAHELSVEGDEAVSAEVREQLFLVLREAVRNAVSHSGAGKLRVEVRPDRERITGIVEDDGRGFDRKRRERPEAGGLAHMAERASLLGAPVRSSRPLAKERAWRRASRWRGLSAPNADLRAVRTGELLRTPLGRSSENTPTTRLAE